MTVVEIAVQDAAGARIAFDAGADRVELCQALGTGGLTPSLGTVEHVLTAAGDPTRVGVLVRPRAGGFVYDRDEIAVAATDIRHLVASGVARLIVGALTEDGSVDADALRRWRDVAPGARFVFHRAIDVVPDVVGAVEELPALGVESVLTSGVPSGVSMRSRRSRR
ncbi:copper homeostasis protein CutC [Humibacter ginsenosidimutans]|uniref:copper homeostasis protein CutC n=1 Tax=Humibacter ginsenosidimutans TaxID=2599293 RepID=UPI00349EA1DA